MSSHKAPAGPWLNVYIDETGTPELDFQKSSVGRYYIAVAVFVDEEQEERAEAQLDQVASRLCSGAEIKSSRIGSDHDRRLAFLQAVQEIDFGYFALAVDKSLVASNSGLRFKTSFYKFFSRLLQGQFGYYGGGLRATSDMYGDSLFMNSLNSYFSETVRPHLFYDYDHRCVSSASSRLVQLADLVAGSLAYWLDPAKASLYSERFRDMLATKETDIIAWPLPPQAPKSPAPSGLDARIEEAAIARASQLLQVLGDSTDLKDRMRAATLDDLLFARLFEDGPRRSIFTDKLLGNLVAHGFEVLPKQAFRSNIIGGLRDRRIVIAGTSEGYRLAISVDDICDYLAHTQNVVEPMLSRVVAARTAVMQDTSSRHDILNDGGEVLRAVVAAFTEAQVMRSSSDQTMVDHPVSEEAEDAET